MEEKKNNAVEKVENIIREKNYTGKEGQCEAYCQQKNNQNEGEKDFQKDNNQCKKGRKCQKGNKKTPTGWIVSVICLGIATLVLSSVLTFTFLMPSDSDNYLENSYQRAFYDTVEQVENMNLNLSKTLATKDKKARQTYLMDLAINSELAENNFQELPFKDENKYYTCKLINQIGDYAKYLNKKLINGEELNEEDIQNLSSLYKANNVLRETLSKSRENMGQDFSFTSLKDNEENIVIDNFTELENLSVEYPELIYDGPFADAKEQPEVLGLSGSEISKENAKDIFIKIFGEYGLKDVTCEGETSGKIEGFNVYATVNESQLYAEISKIGGKLIMFEYEGSCKSTVYQEQEALSKAKEFLESLGFSQMQEVWANVSGNEYTFNFVYSKDDIVCYPDMVKVRVCAETNMVIGLEAESYYFNHTERKILEPKLSREKALEYVFDELDVVNERTALVKKGKGVEKLCYEFCGEFDGEIYYVYIDANNGDQIEMFKVISTLEGNFLL